MRTDWISDPVLWVVALPALACSGLLAQMILSLFSCCGAFTIQGREVRLKWWMIPVTAATAALLWLAAVLYVVWGG